MKITIENLDQVVAIVRRMNANETMLFLGKSDMESYNSFLANDITLAYSATLPPAEKPEFDMLTWRGVKFFITFIGE